MQHATQQHLSTGMFPASASPADSAWDSRAATVWREQLQAAGKGVQASHPPTEQYRLEGVMSPTTTLTSNTAAGSQAHGYHQGTGPATQPESLKYQYPTDHVEIRSQGVEPAKQ